VLNLVESMSLYTGFQQAWNSLIDPSSLFACSLLEPIDLIEFNFDTPISLEWILCRVLEFSPFLEFFC
jgi:hypothetical protein